MEQLDHFGQIAKHEGRQKQTGQSDHFVLVYDPIGQLPPRRRTKAKIAI